MIDATTQQYLLNLTIDDVLVALKELKNCRDAVITTQQEISLADKPELSPLKCIYTTVPDSVGPSSTIKLIPDPLAVCYIRKINPALYEALIEKKAIKKELIAEYLQQTLVSLRDKADEVKHSQGYIPQGIPIEHQQFLQMLANPIRNILSSIDKETQVDDFIHLVLKDIKILYPEIYQQYQELCRAKSGNTPLTQAVKKSISYKYFSGNSGSFCPFYLNDIFSSSQFQAMGNHPKYQLMLLDMIDLCNYLAGSRKDSNIETNGFHYTWNDCRIEVAERIFRDGLKEIIAGGWFTVVGKVQLDDGRAVKMYAPSTDWKKKKISEADSLRIRQYKEEKQKRLKDSRERYRVGGVENQSET